MIAYLSEQMAHEGKVVAAVLCLGEVYIILYGLSEDAPVYLFERHICDKVSFQVCLKKELFIRVLCVQVGAEQIIELVCLQLLCRVEEHLACNRASGGDLFKLLHESGLTPLRKIGILYNLLIDKIQLIHRGLLAQ